MTETGTAKLLAELGELGRVIGLLYQKIEASEHTARNDARLVQEKLDTWIQTNGSILGSNQELLKLIVLNSQELQRSTDSYEKGASLWNSLQQQLTAFEQQMTDWNDSSVARGAPAGVSPEMSQQLSQLSQSCQALNQRLDLLSQAGGVLGVGHAISADAIATPNAIAPQEAIANPANSQQAIATPNAIAASTSPQQAIATSNAIASPNQTPIAASAPSSIDESATHLLKAVVDHLLHSPARLLRFTGAGLALVTLGGLTMFGVQSFKPEYRVETPRPLTIEEAALLNWAQSPEGQQARELMRWNSGLLDDRSCEQDVQRLGVTLELQGKSARSGFCTLWVVPPEKRRFESG